MTEDELRELERRACTLEPVDPNAFNPAAALPYGLTTEHVHQAMAACTRFLQVVNQQLNGQGMTRLESLFMPANFSSVVSEFMSTTIPTYCLTLARNSYHDGHPDLIPAGRYPNNAVQYASEGIEVKASRYHSGWQGHNIEESWLMVFVFASDRPIDLASGALPRPFRFLKVVGAALSCEDWTFSGRSATSRRTITASVTPTGAAKMEANWIYRAPGGGAQVATDMAQPEPGYEADDEG